MIDWIRPSTKCATEDTTRNGSRRRAECIGNEADATQYAPQQLVVAVAVLALAGSQPSYACASPGQREVIFSGLSLPPRLADQPVVAMVAITELLKPSWTSDENWKFTNRVRVVVLAPIRGIDREDEFVIESGVTFCDQWFDDRYMKPALRDRYGWFVAGEFKEGLNGRYFSMNWLSENRH